MSQLHKHVVRTYAVDKEYSARHACTYSGLSLGFSCGADEESAAALDDSLAAFTVGVTASIACRGWREAAFEPVPENELASIDECGGAAELLSGKGGAGRP
mgnify:CR=1 FL=1